MQIKLVTLFLLPTCVFAVNGNFYLSAGIGASRLKVGNSTPQIHYYDGLLTDAYPVRDNKETRAVTGLSGGYEFTGRQSIPALALGLGIYGMPNKFNYKGQLVETALGDKSCALFNYKFHIRSVRAMAEAQFTWMLSQLATFINIGVGPAWSRLNGYSESPVDSIGYVALPPFQSRTDTNLAYQVGLGVGYRFNVKPSVLNHQHEQIALGYRYINLGRASFGTRGDVYPYRLDIGRLTTNEFYLSYTHLF
ncbi:outer membrane protein [Legionella sp. 29fVS95]|uniref:outer membrane protein n=1 Tax=Legionella sp. 29fVS95 TaxID=3402813 RepID=UPI003AF9325E